MNRKPTGVILSAIVLGFAALSLLLATIGTVAFSVVIAHSPEVIASAPGGPAPPPSLLTGIFVFCTFVCLALTAWVIATLVGILRLKPWARISIIVIGVATVLFTLLGIMGTLMSQVILSGTAMPPGADPTILHAVLLTSIITQIAIGAIGVWWISYFASRSTRAIFTPTQPSVTPPPPTPPQYPITDFSTAQPLDPIQPIQSTAATWQTPPLILSPIATAPTNPRPASIVVIAVFLLIGAASCFACSATPFPIFFFGAQFSGWAAHLGMILYAVIAAYCGYGLLKLQRPAWLLAIAIQVLGLLNAVSVLIPSVRHRIIDYTNTLTQSMLKNFPTPPPTPGMPDVSQLNAQIMAYTLPASMLFGAAFVLLFLILLVRARHAFPKK